MKAVVVFESMFGNTEAVATAVTSGLAETMDVELHEVSTARSSAYTADLLVVGGPTHAFSLSRPSTRADALAQGATHGGLQWGLREWLDRVRECPHPRYAAAFDTRANRGRRLPGSAARKASRLLRQEGCTFLATESFYVSHTCGPLLPGETERASAWGRRLAADLVALGGPVAGRTMSR